MGRNLSTLFISQSYQFLTQISGSELQDGLGNTITGSLAITSSQAISSSFATTASFALNAGSTVSTSSLLTTASAAGNVITFTKGDGSTFPVTVATGSGGTGSLDTGSLLITASVVDATITYTKGNGSTFTNTVNNVANAVSATQANEVSVVTDGTNATRYVTFANTLSGYDSNRADAGLTYNPFSNTLTATTFAGNATSATSASLADKVDVTLDGTNNTRFVTFVDATSGASDVKADAGITYNPSTNRLITTTFEGALDGNANTATSASYAVSASQAQNAVTASFALNVTPLNTGSFITTASISNATTTFTKGDGSTFSLTANNVVNADSASLAANATSASFATTAISSSFANNATSASVAVSASFVTSASYAVSASQAQNAVSASYAPAGNPFPFTGSVAISGTIDFNGKSTQTENIIKFGGDKGIYVDATGSVVIGLDSYLTSSGRHNIVIGSASLQNGTTAADNVLIGYRTGQLLTTGRQNVIIGTEGDGNWTGDNLTTGTNNVFIGQGVATNSSNDSSNNILIGYHTGLQGTQGGSNIGLGAGVFREGVGAQNVALGDGAMYGANGADRNIAFGNYTGFDITGDQNIFIGDRVQQIGHGTWTGSRFLAIGSEGPASSSLLYGYHGTSIPKFLNVNGDLTAVGNALLTGSVTITGSTFIDATSNAFAISGSLQSSETFVIDHHQNGARFLSNRSNSVLHLGTPTKTNILSLGRNAAVGFYGDAYEAGTTYSFGNNSATWKTVDFILSGSLTVTGSNIIQGTTTVSGSLRGNVTALTIASNTASLDLSTGNFFTVQLVSGSNTFINPSNILPGQTVNIRVNTTGSATVSFPSSVLQTSGSAYVPTTTTGTDIITLIAFDTSSLFLSNIKNFV
jgi:hypothetical protein